MYVFWILLVVLFYYLPTGETRNEAYRVLGYSVLYFLPVILTAWFITIRKWISARRAETHGPGIEVALIEDHQKQLTGILNFFQIGFLLLLISSLTVAIAFRSGFAIWLTGITIQWFLLVVIHFTESFYGSNYLREQKHHGDS